MIKRKNRNDDTQDGRLSNGYTQHRDEKIGRADRDLFPSHPRAAANHRRRGRRIFSGVLVLFASHALADGAVKLGTYRLAESDQVVNGRSVSFYGLPSQTIGLSIDLITRQRERPTMPVVSFEMFNVEYSLASDSSRPLRGRLDTSALLVNTRWAGREWLGFDPYLGLGAGLSAVDFDLADESENFYQNTISVAGQVFAGVESRFGLSRRFGLLGEVRYFDTAVSTVSSRGAGAFIGLSMRLD